MRTRWKILGGASVAGIWATAIMLGHTGAAADNSSSSPEPSTASSNALEPESEHDPNTPYPLGPGAIPYESLGPAEKAAVDSVEETVETSQPPSSYEAFAAATAWTGERAQAEVAARGVGLTGTEQDGVLP